MRSNVIVTALVIGVVFYSGLGLAYWVVGS